MNKLALCIIAKPTKRESELLDRLLESVAKYVDSIYITITCKDSDNQKDDVLSVAQKWKANVSYFEWINDFAAARNYNFSQVPKMYNSDLSENKDGISHIVWFDCDDVIEGGNQMKPAIEQFGHVDAFIMNYEYSFDEYDNCTTKHMKTRIVKNDGCVEWIGAVHEDFRPHRSLSSMLLTTVHVRHRTDNNRISAGSERNLEIALNQLETKPDDARSYWLAANAYIMANDYVKAKENYEKFLELSKSDEEKYIAWLRLADIQMSNKQPDIAVKSAMKAMILKPGYPDAWYKMADYWYQQGKYRHAKEVLENGMKCKIPVHTKIVYNPLDYTYNPWLLYAKTMIELNEDELAIVYLRKAYQMRPTDSIMALIKTLKALKT